MFPGLDISTTGMVAQRIRLNAISSNMANISTTRNELGQPQAYQPRYVVFQTEQTPRTAAGAVGVNVSAVETDPRPARLKYQPGHPDANADGYVAYPDIDMTVEFVDALEATRAYEANVGVFEITKNLAQQTLRILA
jgi:flagellar basal-body rod protein FlgC